MNYTVVAALISGAATAAASLVGLKIARENARVSEERDDNAEEQNFYHLVMTEVHNLRDGEAARRAELETKHQRVLDLEAELAIWKQGVGHQAEVRALADERDRLRAELAACRAALPPQIHLEA